jgi:hypothetical protein
MPTAEAAATAWFTLNLGDASLAAPRLDQIRSRFDVDGGAGLAGPERAIFIRHVSEGRLHCEAILFFPPPLAALAEEFGARVCAAPSPSGLGVFAGPQATWPVYFPERTGR